MARGRYRRRGGTVRDLILDVPVFWSLAIRFGWSLPVFRASATRERWRNERKDPARE